MLKNIAPDKWKHFFVGILMGAVLQAFLWFIYAQHILGGILISFSCVLVISYGFELFSLITGKGHYDVMDAVASTIGGVIGMSLFLLILFLIH